MPLVLLFIAVLLIEIAAGAFGPAWIQFISKPLLVPILAVCFRRGNPAAGAERGAILAALALSWAGDVILLADKHTGGLFLFGLIAFLCAHFAYIFYFLRIRKRNRPGRPNPAAIAAVLIYAGLLFAFLAPRTGALAVPVGVYAAVIAAMLAVSLSAFDPSRHPEGRLAVAGTALFVISDSILAVNRFAAPFALGPALVMATYGAAQLLIVLSATRSLARRS